MRPAKLPSNMATEVLMYALRDPRLPPLQKGYSPAPISAGVPVLLPPDDDE